MQSSQHLQTIWTYFSDNKERNKENYERDDRKNMIYRICVWTPAALPPNAVNVERGSNLEKLQAALHRTDTTWQSLSSKFFVTWIIGK